MRCIVNGSAGKMGQTIVATIEANPKLELAATVDQGDSLAEALAQNEADVVIDFTRPEVRMATVKACLDAKVPVVVGTTGFTDEDLAEIEAWVTSSNTGCFIGPNFNVGNVLMQQFAQKAAEYYDCAEIVEYHHEQKVDYPSGTAYKTAQLMAETGKQFNPNTRDKVANIEGARGGDFAGIKVHAIRLPGFVASQEVILGSAGERLTIRHDSIDRQSYMAGIFRAAEHISKNKKLIYGLENIL